MFPNKLHVFVARFAVALGFVTSCYVNTCYAILCCFQTDILFSCMQQSMMDDGDDETFPSITVTVRKPLGYQITFLQSRKPLRIGLLVTNETPASSQFLIFFLCLWRYATRRSWKLTTFYWIFTRPLPGSVSTLVLMEELFRRRQLPYLFD